MKTCGTCEHWTFDERGKAYKSLAALLSVLADEEMATVDRRLYPVANIKGRD